MTAGTIRIDIWHNILWSAYKGEVFSALCKRAKGSNLDFRFFQIAETGGDRVSLSGVDLGRHRYPYDLLFNGTYDAIPLPRRIIELAKRTWSSDADLFILTGYQKPEVWIQLALIKIRGKKAAVFCDATIYDNPQTFLKGLVKRVFFKTVDGIFGYGPRSKDYVVHYGASPDKFHFRCQAAALAYDYMVEKALADRLRLAPDTDTPRYLYVGRLSPEKNLERLLRAFALIRKEKPWAELIIVGGGKHREALIEIAKCLGLDADAVFVGSKSGPDLFAEYSKATCFVLPSLSEPWGLVVNEALHYGCPVIVSERCGCVPELVKEGETGFIHDPFSEEDLTDKMIQAVTAFADTKKTAQVCLALMENYTPDRAAQQIIDGCNRIFGTAS